MKWPEVPLDKLGTFIAGVAFSPSLQGRVGLAIPFAKVGDISIAARVHGGELRQVRNSVAASDLSQIAGRLVPPQSIVFAKIGEAIKLNHRAVTVSETLIDNNAMAFVPETSQLTFRYALHVFGRLDFYSLADKTTVPSIRKSRLEAILIPLPPLDEQRRIAAILDKADTLRAKRRAAIAKLESLTQSIFLDMFGDPTSNPKGWKTTLMGEQLRSLHYGPRFYNEKYTPDGIRTVRITDLQEDGTLRFENMPRMTLPDTDIGKYKAVPGDILFARSGATVGKTAVINESDPPCVPGAYFLVLRFSEQLDPRYCRAVLSSPSTRAVVNSRSRQAAQQNFSGPALRELSMPLPPMDLQRRFAALLVTIGNQRTQLLRSGCVLDSLDVSLKHKFFM
jgi:type I restriction enzyme S subunit